MSEIVIENLYKSFDTKDGTVEALKNVNLSIESGDIYGIIGMSGAGKSTLVRCINFLEVPTKGRVLINGKSLGDYTSRELRKQREDIGMIFQHFNLLMQKNVLENVCFPLYIQGKSKKDARKRAKELLDIVGLGDRTGAFPAQLSGGQKQRVAIARALASDPKILLCDEATSALDPQTTSSILALLKDINQRFNITNVIANIVRSIPFLILLILLIPFTRLLVGQSYGSTATIVPLVIAAIPFIGRMVESSIKEVDPGVIEAARSMGASNMQIVMKVLLVEARTSLLTGATIAIGTILGYSAMAGCVGGGGLGDIAIRYGYYRYQTSIMIVTVVLLVILVQIFQSIGMFLAAKLDKRK